MKNVEKYIYIVIGLICLAVLSSGITYLVMSNKSEPTKEESSNKVDENINKEDENKIDNEPIKEPEKIILSTSELEGYLKYIPKDVLDSKTHAYKTFTPFSDKILLGATLEYASNNTDLEIVNGDEPYFEKDSIRTLMHKLYNKDLPTLNESEDFQFSCIIYSYSDNKILQSGGCGYDGAHISLIDDYKASEDELIIYEYAAEYYGGEEQEDREYYLYDYNNDFSLKLDDIEEDEYYEKCLEIAKNKLEENKTSFTKYKHTFKKNDTGYYWVSTKKA